MARLCWRVASVLLLVCAGCGGNGEGDDPDAVVLDGSPRVADDAGRLVDVASDFSSLTIEDGEGTRSYELHPGFVSFSAADGSIQPLLRWRNQYVQLGLDGDEARWLGGVAAIAEVAGSEPVAYYADVLVALDGDAAVFRSGAVLALGPGVELPAEPPVPVVASVDTATHRIVALDRG